MQTIEVRSGERNELIDITDRVQRALEESGVQEGVAFLQSLHTTAALTINENADPNVPHDLVAKAGDLIPHDEPFYRHAEGNSDSHLKTCFFGPSLTVLVSEGRLVLGRWQGVFFCEFDGPRDRRVAMQVLGA